METMCKAMEEMRNEKEYETRTSDIKNVMETFKVTIEQAMDALKIPVSERNIYLSRIK